MDERVGVDVKHINIGSNPKKHGFGNLDTCKEGLSTYEIK